MCLLTQPSLSSGACSLPLIVCLLIVLLHLVSPSGSGVPSFPQPSLANRSSPCPGDHLCDSISVRVSLFLLFASPFLFARTIAVVSLLMTTLLPLSILIVTFGLFSKKHKPIVCH